MDAIRSFLAEVGLPRGDLNELPDSAKRFPDGAQYRIEIPSTEGPRWLEAVLTEAERAGHAGEGVRSRFRPSPSLRAASQSREPTGTASERAESQLRA
jgi:hypothetical protein